MADLLSTEPAASSVAHVRAAQGGDRGAFEKLVAAHAGVVRAVCAGKFGLTQEADDLAQETFLSAYRGLAGLRDPERFDAWLVGIAINTCRGHLTRSRRGPAIVDPEILPHPASADGAPLPEAARHESTRAAVDRLPEIYREVVLLFYFERKSYDEMGRLLGIGKAAVNARLTKARRMLRERLGDR